MRYGERGNVDNKRKFIREYRHPYSMSFISRKLGQREYLSLPFITVITQLCTPLPGRVPPSGWKREIERRRKERIFFFQLRSRKHVCVPRLSRRLIVFTFLQRLTTLSSLYARDWRGDFFRKANQQLRWKEFRRVALSLVFSRPELVAFINNLFPRSVFIQDELSFWWNWKFTRWKFPPPSVFSDNWLPSFSFRWLLLYAKKCTSLIRATFMGEKGDDKKINKLRLYEFIHAFLHGCWKKSRDSSESICSNLGKTRDLVLPSKGNFPLENLENSRAF